jgi:ABC-type multidrug transport system fused ATPase/permease subunit
MSTIAKADRVIVLTGGTIVESGSPAELLRAGGIFARYYAMQSAGGASNRDGE